MNRSTLGRMATASLGIVALGASLFSVGANAADNTTGRIVTGNNHSAANNGAWSLSGDPSAQANFTEALGGVAGNGALELATTVGAATFSSAQFDGALVSDIEALRYSTYGKTTSPADSVALKVAVDGVRSNLTTYSTTLVFEPYMQVGGIQSGTWQEWNASAGQWWSSQPAATSGSCAQSTPCSFSAIVEALPEGAAVASIQLAIGGTSNTAELSALTDDVLVDFVDDARHPMTNSAVRGRRYDFELTVPAPVAPVLQAIDIVPTFDTSTVTVDPLGNYSISRMTYKVVDRASRQPVQGAKVNLVRKDPTLYKQTLGECGSSGADGTVSCLILDSVRPTAGSHTVQAVTAGIADVTTNAFHGFQPTFVLQ